MEFQQCYYLGQAYQHTGEPGRARAMYEKSLQLQGEHTKSLAALGVLCLEQKQYADAAGYFERAINRGAKSAGNYANLGLALRRQERLDEAERAFIQALDLQPDCEAALTNLGYMYLKQGELVKAMNCFARAEHLVPGAMDIQLALAEIYFKRRDLERLVAVSNRLLKDAGIDASETLAGLEDLAALFIRLGETLQVKGDRPMALRAYQVGCLIFPLPTGCKALLSLSQTRAERKACLNRLEDSLRQHGGDPKAVGALKSVVEECQVLKP
jgi:tetratricopeptide (TPR) repeat protein